MYYMAKAKIVLLVTLVGLCTAGAILFVRGGHIGYDPTRIIDSLPENVDMQLSGIKFTEVNKGRREWELESSTLHYMKSDNLMVFDQVEATFFAKDGPMQVSGEKGYYDRGAQKVRLVGNVIGKDHQGNILATNEVRYDVETKIISAPGPFEMKGPELDLSGKGLYVDTNTNRLTVVGRATLLLKSAKNLL